MSFSNLFSTLSGVKQEEPGHSNNDNHGQGSSRKRKLQSPPGSNLKRQCLRSYSAHNNEEPTASESNRYWTRTSTNPRPRVSTPRSPAIPRSGSGHSGNANNPNTHRRKPKNKGRKKEENVYSKRGRRERNVEIKEPRKRFMTQEFKDQHALEVDGHLLCRYFVLGRCTKGEECQLKHIEGYNDLIKESCKFYIQGSCYKGASCPYMHTSIPCKFFHSKGRCRSDLCRFSHEPLTPCTQKVLEGLIQRDKDLAEQSKVDEESVSQTQTTHEEQEPKEEMVIPALSFYQSTEAAVEDEPSLPHTEQKSDSTEQDVSSQTQNNASDSKDDRPGRVCYSVEAMLGQQLFKPVLYTAPETEASSNPVNAPYSVANVLQAQSGYASQNFTPVAPSCELEERAIGARNYKYEASLSGTIGRQNVQPKVIEQPQSFQVDKAYERSHNKSPSGSKLSGEVNKTQEVAAFPSNMALVVGRDHVEDKKQIPKEVKTNKIGECSKVSKQPEGIATSSRNNNESVSRFLPTKRTSTNQKDQKETSDSSLKVESSQASQNVLENTQDFPIGANLPLPRDETKPGFSHLFTNLKSESNQVFQKPDSCKQMFIQATKLGEIATKATDNVSCKSQEDGLSSESTDFHKQESVSSPKEKAESVKTSARSFQSLFTSPDVDRMSTEANALSDKPPESNTEKMGKPSSCTQMAFQTPTPRKYTDNKLEIPSTSGSFNNMASHESSNNNSQKKVSFNATENSKGKTEKPQKSPNTFQGLFANLSSTSEGTSSADTTRNSRQKFVPSSTNLYNKQGANIGRPRAPAELFHNLFAASLQQSTAKNDSKIGSTEPALSQSRRNEDDSSRNEMTEKRRYRSGNMETTAASSSNPWTESTDGQRTPLQPQTGPHTSVFKTLFRQLRPYEED